MEIKMATPKAPPSMELLDININCTVTNNSNCSTPYISAPSSPQRNLNFFYSAPASPRRSSSNPFLSGDGDGDGDFDHPFSFLYDDGPPSPSAVVPFNWEFKPGVPKSTSAIIAGEEEEEEEEGYEFEFSGQLDMMARPSLSTADELFDGGKIRPLKPPPAMIAVDDTPRSPVRKFRDALSPKQRKKNSDEDPFEAAYQNTTKFEEETPLKFNDQNRGRSKDFSSSRTNSRKGISRSLSPLRVSEFALFHQQEAQKTTPNQNSITNGGSSSSRWGSRKWRLKDFLLFRSASEGRATTGKDPLRKYFSLSSAKKGDGEPKNSCSFRSLASSSSMADGSVSRRRGQVSAHELHYTANRAVTGELKKKTSLPYKHGLLGCLGFNPAVHDISKAFGPFARS